MVGYLYPDEEWMTAPQEGDAPDMSDAPEPWAWDEDPEPDYDREYQQRKAEADADWEAWESGDTPAPRL